ncbi:MAG TPA: spore gernimation protein [Desulfotomaculum sp.]|nr:spore gernimation protein [Desulfotomaculum sp.]
MLERGRISCIQTVYMLINVVGATSIVFLPGITAVAAGRDAWLAPLLAIAPGIYLAFIIYSLGKRFPGRTLIEYLQVLLGPWAGKLLGLLYVFFFLHTNAVIIREFGELLVSLVLPLTPLAVIHGILLVLCAWAVRGGLEIQARVMEFAFPFTLFLFMAAVLLVVSEINPANLLPVLENGFKPVIRASLDPVGWRGEIILLAMILPFMSRPDQGGRCAYIAVIAIGILLALDSLANTAVFGPTVARLTFPTFSLVRMVSVGDFIERIESVLVAIWVLVIFGKVAIFYYATVIGIAQLGGLGDYRPLVLPVGVLLAALSLMVVGSATELLDYIIRGFYPFAYIFEFIIPTALLALAAARGIKNCEGGVCGGDGKGR